MKSDENDQRHTIDYAARKLYYPEGSIFHQRAVYGGLLSKLRKLRCEDIRAYHRRVYRPQNVRVIVIGQIDHRALVNAVDGAVPDDGARRSARGYERPFARQKGVEVPLERTVRRVETYPGSDGGLAQMRILLRGPMWEDRVALSAMEVLANCFIYSPNELIARTLVNKYGLATRIAYFRSLQSQSRWTFNAFGVDPAKLQQVEQAFFDSIRAVVNDFDDKELLKMIDVGITSRITSRRQSATKLNDMDVVWEVIRDHIWSGKVDGGESELPSALEDFDMYERLRGWTASKWRGFITRWFVAQPHVVVSAIPSSNKRDQLEEEERKRLTRRPPPSEKSLQRLDAFKAIMSRPPPREALRHLRVPSATSVTFIKSVTVRAGDAQVGHGRDKASTDDHSLQRFVDRDSEDHPLYIHFEHDATKTWPYIEIRIFLALRDIPNNLKSLVPVFTKLFYKSAISKGGRTVAFDEVGKKLDKFSLEYYCVQAKPWRLGNHHRDALEVYIQVMPEDYDLAVKWLETLSFDKVFQIDRVASIAKQLYQAAKDDLKQGPQITANVQRYTESPSQSADPYFTIVGRNAHLAGLQQAASSSNTATQAQLIQSLEKIQKHLFTEENVRVFVSGDIAEIEHPASAFQTFYERLHPARASSHVSRQDIDDSSHGGTAILVPSAALSAAHLVLSAPAPATLTPNQQVTAHHLSVHLLSMRAGPLFKALKSPGLAYGMNLLTDPATATVKLDLQRMQDPLAAFKAARSTVLNHASGRTTMNELDIEAAHAAITRNLASSSSNFASAAENKAYREVALLQNQSNRKKTSSVSARSRPSQDFETAFLNALKRVTADDIRASMKRYLVPLFDPETANLYVACGGGSKLTTIREGFVGEEFDLRVKRIEDFHG